MLLLYINFYYSFLFYCDILISIHTVHYKMKLKMQNANKVIHSIHSLLPSDVYICHYGDCNCAYIRDIRNYCFEVPIWCWIIRSHPLSSMKNHSLQAIANLELSDSANDHIWHPVNVFLISLLGVISGRYALQKGWPVIWSLGLCIELFFS